MKLFLLNNFPFFKTCVALWKQTLLEALWERRHLSLLISLQLPLESSLQVQVLPVELQVLPVADMWNIYVFPPVTMQSMVPFLNIHNDKICDSCLGNGQQHCFSKQPLHICTYHGSVSCVNVNFCSSYVLVEEIAMNTTRTNTGYFNFRVIYFYICTKLKLFENLTYGILLPTQIFCTCCISAATVILCCKVLPWRSKLLCSQHWCHDGAVIILSYSS